MVNFVNSELQWIAKKKEKRKKQKMEKKEIW